MVLRAVWPYLLLTLLCLVFFLPGLSRIPLLDRDEALFVQASKQMMQSHRYDQIKFQDVPRHFKPPGLYWLQAGSTQLFSSANANRIWSYRIPSLLGCLLATLLLFAFFDASIGREAALMAGALLASTLLIAVQAHIGMTDAALLAAMVLMQCGLWSAYRHYNSTQQLHAWGVVLFWLGMTVGVLIKGTSPLIGLLSVLGLCVADRSCQFAKQLKWLWGVLFIVVASLAWIIPFSMAGHSNFLWDMLSQDALPKITGTGGGHGAPPGYFLLILPLTFWPCSLLLYRSIILAWRERKHCLYRFLFAWIIPCWLFIALVHTKLPEYVMPIFPALALLVAANSAKTAPLQGWVGRGEAVYRCVWLMLSLTLALAFPLLSYLLFKQITLIAMVLGLITLLGTLLLYWQTVRRSYKRCVWLSLPLAAIIYLLLFQFFLPSLQPLWISQRLAAVVQQQRLPINAANPVFVTKYHEPSLIFYLGTHAVQMTYFGKVRQHLQAAPGHFGIISEKELTTLAHVRVLARVNGYAYAHGRFLHLVLVESVPS